MESDLLDKVLDLLLISSISCLLRQSHEGSGFVQVLLDLCLEGRRGHGSPQSCSMVNLPSVVYVMISLMDHLGLPLIGMSGCIDRTGIE
jgi:hypothetical protein